MEVKASIFGETGFNFMKKIIIGLVLFLSLSQFHVAKADTVYGFLDGKFYAADGTLKYFCFLNGDCVDVNGQSAPFSIPSQLSTNNPYSSVPMSSNSLGGSVQQISVSPITIQPDPSFTATVIPASGTQITLGKWIVTNNTNTDYSGGNKYGTGNLTSYISFNFTGSESENEGFNNVAVFDQAGGQINSSGKSIIGKSSDYYGFLSDQFGIPSNSSKTLTIKADTVFNLATQVTALTPALQIYEFSGPQMTGFATGTTLTLTH